ncbi:MAG: IS1595 family transposase [Novosphingobium sp.]|nr:IS1595 family transposase [Novosphingobium sp.]MBP6554213.1 IS1595 family transposase [Novosphingobium sp.]
MEQTTQHFLLSAQARALSTKRIHRLSDDAAFAEFVAIRFAENDGEPFCPWCGHKEVYTISTRRTWKCASKVCRRNFSATSRTIFASRKLPYRELLLLAAHFVNAAKGLSAIRMSQELEVTYKTAFVWKHKLREAITTSQHSGTLRGKVEIDGAYFGGHIRPRNNRPLRQDRRRITRRASKRQCVTIFRERNGRSRAFAMDEHEAARIVEQIVEPGSEIFTDQATHFGRIAARYVLRTVNHSERYADGDISTNWAESYFSRLRRAELGTHHHIAGPYLMGYANESSWREDRRRYTNEENYDQLLNLTTHHPVSRQWKGYWQRRKEAA